MSLSSHAVTADNPLVFLGEENTLVISARAGSLAVNMCY